MTTRTEVRLLPPAVVLALVAFATGGDTALRRWDFIELRARWAAACEET
jgi:hypothetical protein